MSITTIITTILQLVVSAAVALFVIRKARYGSRCTNSKKYRNTITDGDSTAKHSKAISKLDRLAGFSLKS